MKFYFQNIFVLLFILFGTVTLCHAQKNYESQITDSLTVIGNSYTLTGKVNVTNFTVDLKNNTITVIANDKLAYIPFRNDNVKRIYDAIKKITSPKYAGFSLICKVENRNIEDLIPNFYRESGVDTKKQFSTPASTNPLLINNSRPFAVEKGLNNRNLAVWQSHGYHYDQNLARWEWQRARIFQTVEDLYTQSYVLPFLVPMLENAGATVFLPRERDTQTNEVIVDNDNNRDSRYREHSDRKSWKKGEDKGFSNSKKMYLHGENPFTLGSYREISTVNDSLETSRVEWFPAIPTSGRYAVYVSYKTLINSASNAHYTVFHKGGKTKFTVNQTMHGGTWLYLGHFYFDKGRSNQAKVMLTNYNETEGKIITADAVKFGGGMGNIARAPYENYSYNDLSIKKLYEPEISGYPRYTEAARYWLQWAGIPDSIYSKNEGKNDYTDDFQSRGNWVNYLTGGSDINPTYQGLKVPIDLALAFHTDAGTTINDSIIGTLGICTLQNYEGKSTFNNGVSRWSSRDLTDIIQTQIVNDIRTVYKKNWTRRGIWNKSYSESRVPEVPTMLLELLSHQNFADMCLGLDPQFRWDVSRSIYKGMLRYLASANNTEYVVQPLPVTLFSCRFIDKTKLELQWVAVIDSLEPTAKAEQFILYTRVDDGGFDNGVLVNSNRISVDIQKGKIYSFKVSAVNKGGQSFPSEILAASRAINEKGEVLIVNGFNRISGPKSFTIDSTFAGFLNDEDPGVPYIADMSLVGKQTEFRRSEPWISDDATGFGASYANYETKIIAGNTFDYPYLHGKAIKAANYSFVSCSAASIINGDLDFRNYNYVDLILGKQKQVIDINNGKKAEFKTFPLALQQKIVDYCKKGGNLLVSGAFVASDIYNNDVVNPIDRSFLEKILKIKYVTNKASVSGNVKVVSTTNPHFNMFNFSYTDTPNDSLYYVESPDGIEPISIEGTTICRYTENNISAAVAYKGSYKTCVFGFPLETIQAEKDLSKIIASVLDFFSSPKEIIPTN